MVLKIPDMVGFKSPEDIQAEIDMKLSEEEGADSDKNEEFLKSLAADIRAKFASAQTAKLPIEKRLQRCEDAVNCKYEADKLKAIEAVYGKGDWPYPPIIQGKWADTVAWLREFLLRPDSVMFGLDPTPMPDLPDSIEQTIKNQSKIRAIDILGQMAMQTGQIITAEMVEAKSKEIEEYVQKEFDKHLNKLAREAADAMQLKIEDQFAEGGFYDEFKDFIDDVAKFPNAFIQGPIENKIMVTEAVMGPTGQWTDMTAEKQVSTDKRISPWNVYPEPGIKNINDGYVIVLKSFNPQALSDMIGVKGYDEAALRAVLQEFRAGGLREWTQAKAATDALQDNSSGVENTSLIDGLIYMGSSQGKLLVEWAGGEAEALTLFEQELDPDKEYQIEAIVIGEHVIKAMLNPDPLGKKNLRMTSFRKHPDYFWSPTSLPEILWSDQMQCCAISRAIVLNVALCSGPQITYSKDRFPHGVSPQMYPFKMYASSGDQMQSGKPVEFWQPQMVTGQLTQVYEFYRQLADEHIGVPRSPQPASKTATATSMEMTAQSRGLKSILLNIDYDIIQPRVLSQYRFNRMYEEMDIFGDCTVVAKGAIGVVAKEQLALRRNEFSNKVFSSPLASQIIGMEGLRELLKQEASGLSLDLEKIFKEDQALEAGLFDPMAQPGVAPQGQLGNADVLPNGSLPRPNATLASGEKAGGGDSSLYKDTQ